MKTQFPIQNLKTNIGITWTYPIKKQRPDFLKILPILLIFKIISQIILLKITTFQIVMTPCSKHPKNRTNIRLENTMKLLRKQVIHRKRSNQWYLRSIRNFRTVIAIRLNQIISNTAYIERFLVNSRNLIKNIEQELWIVIIGNLIILINWHLFTG